MTKINLQQLGIDQKAERVYRALLTLADAKASEIAHEVGMKRTSAYYILDELVRRGLASTYIERGVRRYFAEHPKKLQERLVAEAVIAGRLAEVLAKDIGGKTGRGNVRTFSGHNGILSLMDGVVTTKGKEIRSMGSSSAFLERHGHMAFGERRRKRSIYMRALRFAEDKKLHRGDRSRKLSEVRYFKEGFVFPGMALLYDEGAAFVSDDRGGFGFIVHNAAYQQMMGCVFENLWEQAKRA